MEEYKYKNDNNFEYNRAQTLIFLNLMDKLMHADYEKRLEILKDTWGEIKDFPKIFYYGDYCSVKLYKEDEKIKFDFECSHTDLELLKQGNPEFGACVEEKFLKIQEEQLAQNEKHEPLESEKEEISSADSKTPDTDYLNIYRNINFKN